ncbi:MAG: leucine--tRNA ligase [Chlamydiales bacterium]
MTHYHPQLIEKKWQRFWKDHQSFKASEDPRKKKYYVLDMFPYPSGAGLHVGHLIGYTATDILARYKRSQGFSVLHPMGWDSFGLPAEQYAISTGTHPAETTNTNISNFKKQLDSIGYGYDWEREVRTSDKKYYKWTQWIFTQLYEKGLAYQAELLVNWCPALGTVLANEEVEHGYAKEGGYPIERKPLKQWVLKITSYADRLLEDLEGVDWPEGLKRLQRNWIGRSEGAIINFLIEGREEPLAIFTTCPHTIFGVTYLVLSPEHPLVKEVTTPEYQAAVEQYKQLTAGKSDLERTELTKTKTGVFTGGYARHPMTNVKLPIWIADYVLIGYGTGAIMAVPAHDERDEEFAIKFGLPIKRVINEDNRMVESGHLNGMSTEEGLKAITVQLEKEGMGRCAINYKMRDWLFSRQRYWGEPLPILHFSDGTMRTLTLDELPLEPPQIVDYKPTALGQSPLAKKQDWVSIIDPKTGKNALRETDTMPQWAGSCWYYLRFCDPHNESLAWDPEKEKYWMPVDMYVGGAEHAVLHLLYARFWHKVLYDCGLVTTLEPFQRLMNQGLVVARAYQNKSGIYLSENEVFEKNGQYFHQKTKERLQSQIEKMSKSKLNGISPDTIIEEFGADAMRLYSMFMGPIDKEKVWNTSGISGCRRFLNRFFEMVVSSKVTEESDKLGIQLAHQLVAEVTEDIENLLFNTAIAKMMSFLNAFIKLSTYPKEAVKLAIQVLAPFAPHIAEELWAYLGEKSSILDVPWPKARLHYLVKESVTYIIQVNGKLRGRFDLPKDEEQETIIALAQKDLKIAKYLKGHLEKVIFVPKKLVNFVIR